jgi:predicted Zn-dependent peptidase
VKKWVKNNYCQDNIIFVISGNFVKKSVIRKMKSILKHKKNKKKSHPESHSIFNLGNSFTHVSAPQKEDATVLFLFPYKHDRPNLHMIYSDFFQMLVSSSIQSIIMFELREKMDLIYTSDAELTTYPSSGLFTLDISTKKQNVDQVIKKTIEILETISNGKFSTKILENLKKQFILMDLQESANNDFYTRFYGLQLMNKLSSSNKNTRIYSYKETVNVIDNLKKKEFVTFIKSILNFNDMKVIYQM